MGKVTLRDIVDEVNIDQEDKIYHSGKCCFCGKETAVDQFELCVNCGERFVRLENIPLLTIVPIPYIPIDPKKISFAFKEAISTFKEKITEEN